MILIIIIISLRFQLEIVVINIIAFFPKEKKMKNLELMNITRIFVNGFRFFCGFPVKISNNEIKKTNPILKWGSVIGSFAANFAAMYLYGAFHGADQIRTNPYLVLGYIRGTFLMSCCYIGMILVVRGCGKLVKSVQMLNDLQKEHKFSQKKLYVMLWIAVLQLLILYSVILFQCYLTFDQKLENYFYALFLSFASLFTIIPMFSCELFYVNCTAVLISYFEIFNKDLERLGELYSAEFHYLKRYLISRQ